jgi:hypothetical protein
MPPEVDLLRRRILGAAVMTAAAAEYAPVGAGAAPSRPAAGRGFFPALRHVQAGVLDIAYAELGPAGGPAVILLHGWPYDIHSFVDVAPRLAEGGYRVIVPYLRGYGETRFLSSDTLRNGQPAAVASTRSS